MHHFVRDSMIILIITLFSSSATAMSRLYDAEAVVTIRNGNPCFSYPQDEEIVKRPYSFGHLSVSKNRGGVMWDVGIAISDRKELPEPNSSDSCIEYNHIYPGVEVLKTAEPLQIGTPYNVFIHVSARGNGKFYERKYLSNFCIVQNDNGKQVLIGASGGGKGEWHCLNPGELQKRGFWEKMFAH